MTKLRHLTVMFLALLVVGHTSQGQAAAAPKAGASASPQVSAEAAEPEAPPAPPVSQPAPKPVATSATPLSLRPSPPLELKEEPSDSGWWYKLLLMVAVAAGGAWFYRRHKKLRSEEPACPLRILARASVGAKSELVVVELDDRRLLLGVTPGSISRLEQLPPASSVPPVEPVAPTAPKDAPELSQEATKATSRSDFGKALGEMERRLARYTQARGDDEAPSEEPAPVELEVESSSPPSDLQSAEGGRQARSLLRLARKAK